MALSLVQHTLVATGSNAAPQTASYTSPTTASNLLVCFVRTQVNNPTGVPTDNKSNVWVLGSTSTNYTGSWSLRVYYCNNSIGAVTQISVPMSGTGWNIDIELLEFSGQDTSSPFDVTLTGPASVTSNASSSSPTNGQAITTLTNNAYVVGMFDTTTTTTISQATGWPLLDTTSNGTTIGYVGVVKTPAGSATPQILSNITGWPELAFSLAIKPAAGVPSPYFLTIIPNKTVGPQALRFLKRQPINLPTEIPAEGASLPAYMPVKLPNRMVGPPALRQLFRRVFTLSPDPVSTIPDISVNVSDTIGSSENIQMMGTLGVDIEIANTAYWINGIKVV